MQNITVSKEKLLATLKANRADHYQLFLEAQKVFKDKVVETLEERLKLAREGGKIQLWIALPEPQDYTTSFDQAIAMVEWAEGDTIDLSERDFSRYVLNEWEWAKAFAENTGSYVNQ